MSVSHRAHEIKMTTYNPRFHQDGTITYWRDSYGWFYRVHPALIPGVIIAVWDKKYIAKWENAMGKKGYIKVRGKWIPGFKSGMA